MPTRCVLLADVVKSANLPDRQAFDTHLHDTLADLEDALPDTAVGRFETTKGIDEFGGVIRDFGSTYPVIRTIQERLHPVKIRFAVSIDEVDVNPDASRIGRMDGPALHAGTRVLEKLDRSDMRFGIHPTEGVLDAVLVDQVNLLLFAKERWTERQLEIASTYRDADKMTEAAAELDVSVQRVSDALGTIYGTQILAIEDRVENQFRAVAEGGLDETIRGE